jgi:hypothetical protein
VKRLGEARTYLEHARTLPDCTEDMGRTSERLMLLVETLETRVAVARDAASIRTPMEEDIVSGAARLEKDMREVAEASGVRLEGEPDDELDLDELERAALQEMPEESREERYTVLEVTPKEGIDLIRKRKEGD